MTKKIKKHPTSFTQVRHCDLHTDTPTHTLMHIYTHTPKYNAYILIVIHFLMINTQRTLNPSMLIWPVRN